MESSRAERFQAFVFALAIHIAALLLLTVSLSFNSAPRLAAPPASQVMQAVAVDQGKVDDEVKKLKAAAQRKKDSEQKQQKELEQKADQARKQREAEEQRLKDIQQRKADEEQQLKQAQALKQQQETERQKALDDKKRIEEEQRRAKAEQKAAEDAKRKAEDDRRTAEEARQKAEDDRKTAEDAKQKAEADRKAAEDARKQADDDRRRKAQEARDKAEAEQRRRDLESQLQEEEKANLQAQAQGVATEYSRLLRERVGNLFNNPAPGKGLKCTLFVRIDHGGNVQDVQVVKSSGNAPFDRQAEIAVRKASPLPPPPTSEKSILDMFVSEGFNFEFEPQD